ncbi:hypothetical protein T11_6289 [Trichinella zimbabwensis]|uniref:Uncharacterized protein n=1 Tax=Trichinella zimbabwensis TaxID=268475 RepID=A0A0V1GHT1_9BILA|nr:hypothetical protein T11_6289 [Trichinella zimbabwensis]
MPKMIILLKCKHLGSVSREFHVGCIPVTFCSTAFDRFLAKNAKHLTKKF